VSGGTMAVRFDYRKRKISIIEFLAVGQT
jgi:hypothetical protein